MKRITALVLAAALSIAAHADQETQDKVLKATQNVTMSIFSAYFEEAIARAKGYPAGGNEKRLNGLEMIKSDYKVLMGLAKTEEQRAAVQAWRVEVEPALNSVDASENSRKAAQLAADKANLRLRLAFD